MLCLCLNALYDLSSCVSAILLQLFAFTVVFRLNNELANGDTLILFNCLWLLFGRRQVPEEKEHFSAYAFDSKTGAARWKHEPEDYETDRISREVLISSISSARLNLLS